MKIENDAGATVTMMPAFALVETMTATRMTTTPRGEVPRPAGTGVVTTTMITGSETAPEEIDAMTTTIGEANRSPGNRSQALAGLGGLVGIILAGFAAIRRYDFTVTDQMQQAVGFVTAGLIMEPF